MKVLGALAMIDGGEADWKLLAIRTDDPLAAQVDGECAERHLKAGLSIYVP